MPTLEIPAGETERLIPDDQSGRRYKLQVLSGKVSLGHTERYADDGRVYGPGASGIVERLQDGDSDRPHLFAFAHEDAEVQLDSVGFLFDLFSTQPAQERSVNITSADATVNTDIVADDATIDTDITAQSIGDLGIDIQAQSVAELEQNQSRRAADSVNTYSEFDTIPASDTVIIEQEAPTDSIRELLDTRMTMSPNGTNTPSSGSFSLELGIGGGLNELLEAAADSSVSEDIIYSHGEFASPSDYTYTRPSTPANQPIAKMRHFVDDTTAFRWRFDNNTDVEYEYSIEAVFKDTQT